MTRSILPPEMRGVMYISGFRGVGKSTLASTADFPNLVEMWDFENKGEGIHAQVNFARYLPLTQNASGVTYYSLMEAVNGILPTTTVVILDNIAEMEKAFRAEAKSNAKKYADKYGLSADNIASGRFGGASAVVNPMVSELCAAIHAKGVRLIIATAHVSPRWSSGGPIPNKFNVKGADRWQELSILSLILYRGDAPTIEVPNALVQKEQLGTITVPDPMSMSDEDYDKMMRGELGANVRRRLPFKIPNVTFQKIRHYMYHPADIHNPKPGEMPTLEESDPFSDKLSKEQFEIARDMARAEATREEQEKQEREQLALIAQNASINAAKDAVMGAVKQVLSADATLAPPAVAAKLKEMGVDAPMPIVVQAVVEVKNSLPI